jgi:hypothetical protein
MNERAEDGESVLLDDIGGILVGEQLLYRLLEGLAFVEGSGGWRRRRNRGGHLMAVWLVTVLVNVVRAYVGHGPGPLKSSLTIAPNRFNIPTPTPNYYISPPHLVHLS